MSTPELQRTSTPQGRGTPQIKLQNEHVHAAAATRSIDPSQPHISSRARVILLVRLKLRLQVINTARHLIHLKLLVSYLVISLNATYT